MLFILKINMKIDQYYIQIREKVRFFKEFFKSENLEKRNLFHLVAY